MSYGSNVIAFLERHKATVLKVRQEWLAIDQFLSDFARKGKHRQPSILKFANLH